MTTSSKVRPTRTDSTSVTDPTRPDPARFEAASAVTAVLFTGLFAGLLITVAVFESSLRGVGASVYTQVRLIELDRLGALATVLLLPAIVATAALAVTTIRRRGTRRRAALTALLLLLTASAISAAISVPINTVQQGWSVLAPPSDWSAVRDRWQLAHLARTTAAALAFALLAVVATSPRLHATNVDAEQYSGKA